MALAGSCAGQNLPPEPDSYVAADAIGAERAADLAISPAATWLDDLNSAEMSALAREALAGSPDLQIVEARYRAARWRARGSFGGNLLPSLSVGVDGTRSEAPTLTDERIRTEFMTSSVVASWEIDLWGRLTSRALASDSNADAARQDLNDARLSVAGQSSQAWVNLISGATIVGVGAGRFGDPRTGARSYPAPLRCRYRNITRAAYGTQPGRFRTRISSASAGLTPHFVTPLARNNGPLSRWLAARRR